MTYHFTLQTNGFHIIFRGEPVHSNEALDTIMEFHLHPCLGGRIIQSDPTFIRVDDLKRFLGYLDQHIGRLQQNSSHISGIFVPLELGFQAQAFQGDILDDDQGDFAFSFMVNVCIPDEDEDGDNCYTRVYVGGKTEMKVSDVRKFIHTVQAIIEEVQPQTE